MNEDAEESRREQKRVRALAEAVRGVLQDHGLHPEAALAGLIPVVAEQLTAFIMGDALEASRTALSRSAILKEAEGELRRFSEAVQGHIAGSLEEWGRPP